MFILRIFILITSLLLTKNLLAQSSLNWSLKSLVNNIQKINIKTDFEKNRHSFFQNEFQNKEIETLNLVSSSSRSALGKTAKVENDNNDDLVLYDYSNGEDKIEEKEFLPKKQIATPAESKDYVYDYTVKDEQVCKVSSEEKISHVSLVDIQTESVFINERVEKIQNFEITFFDDRDQIITSNSEGFARLGEESILARANASRQIKIYSVDHYQVSTKIDFSEDQAEYTIPLLEKNSLLKILEDRGIPGYEGLLLLAVDNQVQNIYIDKPYKERFYFSSDFKLVDPNLASYILYSGVDLGNTEITLENENETTYKTIVHLRSEEIYYYVYDKAEPDTFEVEVCQQELLGSTKRSLSISGKQVELYGSETKAEKININKYRFPRYKNTQYEKDYLIFKHLSEDIMLSRNNANYVELPSQNFLNYLIQEFELNEVHCIVQFNFTKAISSVDIEGYTSIGFLEMDISYLDRIGLFDSVINENTKKAYISAQGEGSIYTKLTYANGAVDYVESFCGAGSYSVEQL